MEEDGFYITLPSNTSLDLFPENTSASFMVRLFKPLDLRGEWEVGLAEIQYPHTWYTIPQAQKFIVYNEGGEAKWRYHLRQGYYDNIPQLLGAMNALILKGPQPRPVVNFFYDEVAGKIRFNGPQNYSFSFEDQLATLLGVPIGKIVKKTIFSPDITGGFNSLYIYTDIVDHQLVGDTAAPLLRCVPVRGAIHDFTTITYDKPHYVAINKLHIKTISVEIKTHQNRHVSFCYGKVIVRLHLRQRKKW